MYRATVAFASALLSRDLLDSVGSVKPGGFVVLFGGLPDAIEARRHGLHLRDSFVIFLPGPKSLPAFLFRRPLSESTVYQQVLTTQTGAINIDAVRVPGVAKVPWGKIRSRRIPRPEAAREMMSQELDGPADQAAPPPNPLGRWPPNILLVHSSECQPSSCTSRCALPPLRESTGNEDAVKSIPQFSSLEAMTSWFEQLITPAGAKCLRGV